MPPAKNISENTPAAIGATIGFAAGVIMMAFSLRNRRSDPAELVVALAQIALNAGLGAIIGKTYDLTKNVYLFLTQKNNNNERNFDPNPNN